MAWWCDVTRNDWYYPEVDYFPLTACSKSTLFTLFLFIPWEFTNALFKKGWHRRLLSEKCHLLLR